MESMGDPASNNNSTVLVVEDEALLRLCAAGTLEDSGFHVLEAGDASEALWLLESHPEIRVLFTDVQMPGKYDGLQLAQLVHEHWPRVVLLVTSGGRNLSDKDVADHGKFIAKPYSPRQVVEGIEGLMQQQTDRSHLPQTPKT